jgi:hypothetical protein
VDPVKSAESNCLKVIAHERELKVKNVVAAMGVAILAAIAATATPKAAFAQAGSTGGIVGKTSKSVSGGEPQTRPAPARAVFSLAGTWQWRADCSNGTHWEATFAATPNDSGSYALNFDGAGGGTGLGTVSGTHVTLLRNFSIFHQTWTATLAGGNLMKGSVKSSEGGFCTFEASR